MGIEQGLKPCPFCGGEALVHENDWCEPSEWSVHCWTETCAVALGSCSRREEAIAAWNTRASPPPAQTDGESFWLVLHEPGCVPELKGSWPLSEQAAVLREFIRERPTAYIDVLTIQGGEPLVEHGPEVLQILDGRSMSVGRRHNEQTRVAHAEAHQALSAAPPPLVGRDGSSGAERAASVASDLTGAGAQSPDGWVLVPRTPPEELLMSMAVRQDHALGCPGYYDQDFFGAEKVSHHARVTIALSDMRKVYEEVVGDGFYKPEHAGRYRQMMGRASIQLDAGASSPSEASAGTPATDAHND